MIKLGNEEEIKNKTQGLRKHTILGNWRKGGKKRRREGGMEKKKPS